MLDIEPEFGYTVYRISENVNIVNEEEIQVGRNITFNISQARSSISGSEGNHILNITGGRLTIIQQPREATPVERVLAGIRDNFNLTTDVFGGFVFPDEMDDIDNAPVFIKLNLPQTTWKLLPMPLPTT
jgi:hypothetical protein